MLACLHPESGQAPYSNLLATLFSNSLRRSYPLPNRWCPFELSVLVWGHLFPFSECVQQSRELSLVLCTRTDHPLLWWLVVLLSWRYPNLLLALWRCFGLSPIYDHSEKGHEWRLAFWHLLQIWEVIYDGSARQMLPGFLYSFCGLAMRLVHSITWMSSWTSWITWYWQQVHHLRSSLPWHLSTCLGHHCSNAFFFYHLWKIS